jgi:hypothetical protein
MADLVAATSAAASIVIGTGVLSFSAPLIYDGINLLRVGGSYDGKHTFSNTETDPAAVVLSL